MVKQRRSLVMVHRRGWLQLAGLREVRKSSDRLTHFHQTKPSANITYACMIGDVCRGGGRHRVRQGVRAVWRPQTRSRCCMSGVMDSYPSQKRLRSITWGFGESYYTEFRRKVTAVQCAIQISPPPSSPPCIIVDLYDTCILVQVGLTRSAHPIAASLVVNCMHMLCVETRRGASIYRRSSFRFEYAYSVKNMHQLEIEISTSKTNQIRYVIGNPIRLLSMPFNNKT